jgi:hypothetical protein
VVSDVTSGREERRFRNPTLFSSLRTLEEGGGGRTGVKRHFLANFMEFWIDSKIQFFFNDFTFQFFGSVPWSVTSSLQKKMTRSKIVVFGTRFPMTMLTRIGRR